MIYKMGVPFWGLMAIHGIIGIITFIETWFNVPADPIPTLEEQRLTQEYEMSQIQKKKTESKWKFKLVIWKSSQHINLSFQRMAFKVQVNQQPEQDNL